MKKESKIYLWTMIARYGHRHHLASDTFIPFCGRNDLSVRSTIEVRNGELFNMDEGKLINESHFCKRCIKLAKLEIDKIVQ